MALAGGLAERRERALTIQIEMAGGENLEFERSRTTKTTSSDRQEDSRTIND
jgi:hypothetical protein